ncbi:hypothetical protein K4A83_12460 [Spirulina subsalsa FACHB-351]|uniref:Uncharacterized protein n=1 Tax=Spirulina subsalsa FACHB-351 TaxID=234711 RepID=A0ABT3L6E3_9CYAN|nr:hypothetical protein [Spirulina subsalsa]MCW6037073.1 hypothetical protein [Spirulina subsalsa FACHB-351]
MTSKTSHTHPLKTQAITLMSNITSLTITGEQVSKLGSEIHATFAAKNSEKLPCVLNSVEEIGFILQPDDAIQLGRLLMAMGLESQGEQTMEEIQEKLDDLIKSCL